MAMSDSFNVVDHLLHLGFRTQARLARAGEVSQSVVAYWKANNSIPDDRKRLIIAAAADEGIEIYPDDFFEPELRRMSG